MTFDIEQGLGVGTLGTVLVAVVTHWLTRRKFNAEVAKEMNEAVKQLIEMLRSENDRQASARDACEVKCAELQRQIDELKKR